MSILSGSTFVVSDGRGDIRAGGNDPLGLFWRDMRHLSTWRLLMNGRGLEVLSSDTLGYDEAAFFLVQPTGTVYRNPSVAVVRRRFVGDGFREDLQVSNSGVVPVRVELTVLFDADFTDVFEVKDRLPKQGHVRAEDGTDGVVFRYERGDFRRATRITCANASFTAQSLSCRLTLDAGATWGTEIEVVATDATDAGAGRAGAGDRSGARHAGEPPRPQMPGTLDEWVDAAPRLDTDWDALTHTYERSLDDLAALRFYPPVLGGADSVPAAGLPWFMTLFGRDSILTSVQSLPFVPELARATLRALAQRQAPRRDDFRDAEPGKILHEIRFGELVHFGERPQSPYYGAADTTPLWLVLLDEYHRWSGDDDLVQALEPAARAALRWLDEGGDRDGDGYVEYERRNTTTGLENQCWKDSWNSVVHPDGSLASLPRATCELQGYAYDARVRAARLAREVWHDEALAGELEDRAATLRRRFDEDFWVADGGFFAFALDGAKRQVRTLTSNVGHLLWSGIVEDARVDALVGHLMGDSLFSGWGCARSARDSRRTTRSSTTTARSAARQRVHRRGPGAVRTARRGEPDRGRDARRGGALRASAAGGVRRLRPDHGGLPGRVPDRVLTPSGGDRRAAAPGAGHARPRARRCPPARRAAPARGVERLALYGVPERWGRVDATATSR